MGIVFFLIFMAYDMIQGYSANLYGQDLGSIMGLTLYAVFSVSCFFAPTVTNKIGTRLTMTLGITGYGALVAASLIYSLGLANQWIIVVGGALNGVGAALLWTAGIHDQHNPLLLFHTF